MNKLVSLKNFFTIVCDAFEMNTFQIEKLLDSMDCSNADKYNVVANMVATVQKKGGFELENASKIYNSLMNIRSKLLGDTSVECLDVHHTNVTTIVNDLVLQNNIYSLSELRDLNLLLEQLEKSESNEIVNKITKYIEMAQSKGRLTLKQAYQTYNLLCDLKK